MRRKCRRWRAGCSESCTSGSVGRQRYPVAASAGSRALPNAENTDIEGVKGGLSGAMKRAAVQWGIGRYLYALEEGFAQVSERGKLRGKTKQGTDFKWDPPQLPAWALPPVRKPEPAVAKTDLPRPAATAEPAAPARDEEPAPEHEAMLQFVRQVGSKVEDTAEIRINRKVRNLKDFVRENWPTIKEQPKVARAVVEAIETATGTAFETGHAA